MWSKSVALIGTSDVCKLLKNSRIWRKTPKNHKKNQRQSHENQSSPTFLTDNDWLHIQVKKCQLILEDNVDLTQNHSDAERLIVDGSALVNAMQLKISKNLEEYGTLDFSKFSRIDLVLDVYKSRSIKDGGGGRQNEGLKEDKGYQKREY